MFVIVTLSKFFEKSVSKASDVCAEISDGLMMTVLPER
jgi:hypothetical protein